MKEKEKTVWLDVTNKIMSFHMINNGKMITKTESRFWEYIFGLISSGYRIM